MEQKKNQVFYSTIKRAVIEVNGKCNYKCKMCPIKKDSFLTELPLIDFKRIVDECKELGVEVVQLDGSGEATLTENLPEYIQYLTDNNIKSHIYSNGYLMQNELMKNCVNAGLSLFRFSVIGYNEETYYK